MVAVELDLETPPGDGYGQTVAAWFETALNELAGAELERLAEQGPLPADSVRRNGIPCGPAGGLWGFVSTHRRDAGKLRKSRRVISDKNIAWLIKQLADPPFLAEVGITTLDEQQMPGRTLLRITHNRDDVLSPDWLRLRLSVDLAEQDAATGRQGRLTGFLRTHADRLNPSYGHIETPGTDGTALETCLRGAWYRDTIPNSRTQLRGYSWVTTIAEELIEKVGGLEKLRSSEAFAHVIPMRSGGLWLQATERLEDYDDFAVERVWEALRPVLMPGQPSDPYPPGRGPAFKLVFRDAAEPN